MIYENSMTFDPEKYRPDFPILGRMIHRDRPLVYLDNAASTQRPRQVIESIVDTYENHYANVHRGIHQLAQDADDRYEAAREKVRALIGAAAVEEIIFTSGTTAAINLVARSWGDANLRAGDEILLTEMEHHSNLVPWQQLAARTGAVLRHIPLTDDGLLQLDAFDRLLGKRTKIVAFAAVSNVLGTIAPAKEIIRRAHEVGAVALVDGAQSVPHQKTDVADLDCDFLAFSGHKMLGPTGVGVLYGKRELLEAMPPFLGGGSMIKEVYLDRFSPGELPSKFEAGTPPIVPAIALGAAIDYLECRGNRGDPSPRTAIDAPCARSSRPGVRRADFGALGAGDQQGGHREFHDGSHPRPRCGATARPARNRRSGGASLRHALARALRHFGHGPGEFLFLQHDGGSGEIGRSLGRRKECFSSAEKSRKVKRNKCGRIDRALGIVYYCISISK